MDEMTEEPHDQDQGQKNKQFNRRQFLRFAAVAAAGATLAACRLPRGTPTPPKATREHHEELPSTREPTKEPPPPSPTPEKEVIPEVEFQVVIPPGEMHIAERYSAQIGISNNLDGNEWRRSLIFDLRPTEASVRAIMGEAPLEDTLITISASDPEPDGVSQGVNMSQSRKGPEEPWIPTAAINVNLHEPNSTYGADFVVSTFLVSSLISPASERNWQEAGGRGYYPTEERQKDMGRAFAATAIVNFGQELNYEEYTERLRVFRGLLPREENQPVPISRENFDESRKAIEALKVETGQLPMRIITPMDTNSA